MSMCMAHCNHRYLIPLLPSDTLELLHSLCPPPTLTQTDLMQCVHLMHFTGGFPALCQNKQHGTLSLKWATTASIDPHKSCMQLQRINLRPPPLPSPDELVLVKFEKDTAATSNSPRYKESGTRGSLPPIAQPCTLLKGKKTAHKQTYELLCVRENIGKGVNMWGGKETGMLRIHRDTQ